MTYLANFSRIIATAFAVTAASSAFAVPALPGKFSQFYNDKGIDVSALAGQSCRLCHAGIFPNGGNLNSFAADLRDNTDVRARAVDFGAIEGLDSDGDGASNLDEITAGTLPGDASSRP
jgi:hypothetical protein